MKQIIFSLFFCLIMIPVISPVYSEIYEWTDENGVRHYGNANPENDTEIKVTEEIEHDSRAHDTSLKERTERHRKRVEEQKIKEEEERKAKEQDKLEHLVMEKNRQAYTILKQLDDLVFTEINWTEYQELLSKATQQLGLLENNSKQREYLFDALKCYILARDMWKAHNADKKKTLRKMYDQIKKEWNSEANTYYQGRTICWERAREMLNKFQESNT